MSYTARRLKAHHFLFVGFVGKCAGLTQVSKIPNEFPSPAVTFRVRKSQTEGGNDIGSRKRNVAPKSEENLKL